MIKTESRLQYDLIKFYAYYNTRLNLPLFTNTQVIDPETNQPVMVKKEIKNKKIKENKEIKNGKAPLCPSDISPQKGRDFIKQNNAGNSSLLCGEVPQSGGGVLDKHNNAINNNKYNYNTWQNLLFNGRFLARKNIKQNNRGQNFDKNK